MDIGDINGDDRDDLFIGSWAERNGTECGYFVLGQPTWPALFDLSEYHSNVVRIYCEEMNVDNMFAVSHVGDVNRDGLGDAVLGASSARNFTGDSYLFLGQRVWPEAIDLSKQNDNVVKIMGEKEGDYFGAAVGSAKDLNKDGFADFAIGAPLATSPSGVKGAGCSYWFLGQEVWPPVVNLSMPNSNVVKACGQTENAYHGISIAAGKFNGDRFSDLALGSPGAEPLGRRDAGCVDVVFGYDGIGRQPFFDLSKLNGTNGFQIIGTTGGMSGYALAVGDLNNDRFDDLAIGSPDFETVEERGSVDMMFGHDGVYAPLVDVSTFNGTNGCRIIGEKGDCNGYTVGFTDINDDGIADLAMGAPWASINTEVSGTGCSSVVYGNGDPWPASLNTSALNGYNGFRVPGERARYESGFSVCGGDLNGDGIKDFAIGNPWVDDEGRWNTGSIYTLFGRTTPTTPTTMPTTTPTPTTITTTTLTTTSKRSIPVSSSSEPKKGSTAWKKAVPIAVVGTGGLLTAAGLWGYKKHKERQSDSQSHRLLSYDMPVV